MPRPRERVRLEDGLKLDLNKLIRQKLVRPGPKTGAGIRWSYLYSGEEIAFGRVSADMTHDQRGLLRLELGNLDQWIDLETVPRQFGGRQWYCICPRTARRVLVLWKPPGSRFFASRQAWGRQVAYGSQFETPRAGRSLRHRLFAASLGARITSLSTTTCHRNLNGCAGTPMSG